MRYPNVSLRYIYDGFLKASPYLYTRKHLWAFCISGPDQYLQIVSSMKAEETVFIDSNPVYRQLPPVAQSWKGVLRNLNCYITLKSFYVMQSLNEMCRNALIQVCWSCHIAEMCHEILLSPWYLCQSVWWRRDQMNWSREVLEISCYCLYCSLWCHGQSYNIKCDN